MSLPEIGAIIGDKYRVERMIGSGGMGAVFEVGHLVTGKHFAIKWLLPEVSSQPGAVKRFLREAQVAGRFEHPNVIEIYDIGQQEQSYYIVMELLQGESLADRLKRSGAMSVADACEVLVPCIEGVAAAHQAGVIHRDIKPSNIFLCTAVGRRRETPKIVDFGIARLSSQPGQPDSTLTKSGTLIGTPHYMAPEQIRGADIDVRVDVYAFGVVLYEALTGQLPFVGDSYADLILSVLSSGPNPIQTVRPDLPAELCAIIEKAMARDRNDRYATLFELSTALTPFCSAGPPVSAAASSQERIAPQAASEPIRATPFAADNGAVPTPARSQRALTWAAYGVGLGVLLITPVVLYVRHSASERAPETHLAAPLAPKPEALAKPEPDDQAAELLGDIHPNVQPISPEVPFGSYERRSDAGVVEIEPKPSAQRHPNAPSSARVERAPRRTKDVPPYPAADHRAEPPVTGHAASSGSTQESVPGKPRVSLGSSDFQSGARDAGAPARPKTTLDRTGF